MTLHTADLRRQAGEALKNAPYNPKKLVLIHTAIALGATLLVTVLQVLVSRQIAETGGLSGIGTRARLTTALLILWSAVAVAQSFWEIGLIRAVLNWVKGESAEPPVLLAGFRQFGAIIRLKLLTGFVFFAIIMAASNIGYILFTLSPFFNKFMAVSEMLMEEVGASANGLPSEEAMFQFYRACIPAGVISFVVFAAMAIPVFYRIRFAEFSVMEGNRALISLLESVRITWGSTWQLIKLDLSFWWFYLLQGLCLAVSNGDSLLKAAGLSLPISADGQLFLFYILGIVGQLVLLWQCQAKVSATYGFAYRTLKEDTVR